MQHFRANISLSSKKCARLEETSRLPKEPGDAPDAKPSVCPPALVPPGRGQYAGGRGPTSR
jgi:hypothetical protein